MLRKIGFLLTFITLVAICSLAQSPSAPAPPNAGLTAESPAPVSAITDAQLRKIVRLAVRPYTYGPEETLADYRYRMLVTSMELDKNQQPNPKDTETELYEVKPVNGRSEETLLEHNGKPLNHKELEKQEKNAEKNRAKRHRGVERAFIFGPEFMEAMDFEVSERSLQNQTLTVKFMPKKNPPRLKNDLLKSLAGTLWIEFAGTATAPAKVTMTKYEMHLIKSVRLLAGIVASASEMQLNVDLTLPPDKPRDADDYLPWLPKKMDIRLALRVIGIKVRPRIIREYSAFERVLPRIIHGVELSPKK